MSSGKYANYKIYKVVSYVLGGLILAVVAGAVFGFLVKFLWNETIASMFSLTAISFWQAFGLFFLAKLFFGFGGSGSPAGYKWKKQYGRYAWMKDEHGNRLNDDETFRDYWREQGKGAYKEFRETKSGEDTEQPPKE